MKERSNVVAFDCILSLLSTQTSKPVSCLRFQQYISISHTKAIFLSLVGLKYIAIGKKSFHSKQL